MKKVPRFVRILLRMSQELKTRDKFMKIIQFGCMVLCGYYGRLWFSKERLATINLVKYVASTSRKSFWLFKSIGYLFELYKFIQQKSTGLLSTIDACENLFLSLYFFYENMIWLNRVSISDWSESSIDPLCNNAWFFGDISYFCSSFFRMTDNELLTKSLLPTSDSWNLLLKDPHEVELSPVEKHQLLKLRRVLCFIIVRNVDVMFLTFFPVIVLNGL